MNATLFVSCDDLDSAVLQELSRNLSLAINRETDFEARIAENAPGSGSRGDPITIGEIVLTFINLGGATALIGVLRSYIARGNKIAFRMRTGEGRELTINASNIDSKELTHLTDKFFQNAR